MSNREEGVKIWGKIVYYEWMKNPQPPIDDKRPWGHFRQFCTNVPATVKIISINPNGMLSLQSHAKREEFWRVIAGDGTAVIGDNRQDIKIEDELTVPPGVRHRLSAGAKGLEVMEISFGEFDENDIVRYEDAYGRI